MPDRPVNSLHSPVYHDAGFVFPDIASAQEAFACEREHPPRPGQYIYSRYRNPTIVAVEEQLMAIEESSWAMLFQSGMAAIDTALSIFQHGPATGPWLFFTEIYGGTNTYIDRVLKFRRGLNAARFPVAGHRYDLDLLERQLDELQPKLLYFEAVSNPMLVVADTERILALAKERGITTLVDNTFATPYLWKPLADGADLVIHSATKYLGGHGDITAGVLCGHDPELARAAIEYRKWVGHMLSPDEADRLGTYLRSFELRMSRHCENARRLAGFLERHPAVESVLYPGLPGHPTHAEAVKLFGAKGFGGMITFSLQGKDDAGRRARLDRLVESLRDRIPLVPTMGEDRSILLPIIAVWGDKYPFPGMVRLSVGIEPYPQLESWLAEALAS